MLEAPSHRSPREFSPIAAFGHFPDHTNLQPGQLPFQTKPRPMPALDAPRLKKDERDRIRRRLTDRFRRSLLQAGVPKTKLKLKDWGIDTWTPQVQALGRPPGGAFSLYHIDHAEPLCSFNLKDLEQVREAWDADNLRWLIRTINLGRRKPSWRLRKQGKRSHGDTFTNKQADTHRRERDELLGRIAHNLTTIRADLTGLVRREFERLFDAMKKRELVSRSTLDRARKLLHPYTTVMLDDTKRAALLGHVARSADRVSGAVFSKTAQTAQSPTSYPKGKTSLRPGEETVLSKDTVLLGSVSDRPRKANPWALLPGTEMAEVRGRCGIPDCPTRDIAPAVRVPPPPYINPKDEPEEQAWAIVQAYRAACKHLFGDGDWMLAHPQNGLARSRTFPLLKQATALMLEHKIRPHYWAAWVLQTLCFRKGKKPAKTPPPLKVIFASKQIIKWRGWYRREAGDFKPWDWWAPTRTELIRTWGRMHSRLRWANPDPADTEAVRAIVHEYLPPGRFEELVTKAQDETNARALELEEYTETDVWIWN